MFKKVFLPLCLVVLIFSCKNGDNVDPEAKEREAASATFDSLLDSYYEDGLRLDPIAATTSGDMRYNDHFPDYLSQSYNDSLRNYYTFYRDEVSKINDAMLSENEMMSKDILLWETNMNLQALDFDKEKFMPIDQMWSRNLFMGQLASGASSQPFNTVEDYRNWMNRVDGYLTWLNSAEANMREGMSSGVVLPNSLIVKVIPQMEAMAGDDARNHLFYGPINNFPESFTAEEKEELTKA